MRMSRASSRGFTLIELMITVAIVAILAAVAVPAYNDYIRRGYITDAVTTLGTHRVRMEQYYQDNRNYGSTGTTCGLTVPTNARYTYTCTMVAGGQSYSLSATGATGLVVGYDYSINQTGAQSTTKYKGATVTKSCWVIRGSEC